MHEVKDGEGNTYPGLIWYTIPQTQLTDTDCADSCVHYNFKRLTMDVMFRYQFYGNLHSSSCYYMYVDLIFF